LRDFPDLTGSERQRFVENALAGCRKLENGIGHLSTTVYEAGRQAYKRKSAGRSEWDFDRYAARITVLEDLDVIEVDFSELSFHDSNSVNDFYDVLDMIVGATDRDWYFAINIRDCSVWPEAWIAFAHRGKKLKEACSLGTVRYSDSVSPSVGVGATNSAGDSEGDVFCSRTAALAKIDTLRP
jgi:hypothetical protein